MWRLADVAGDSWMLGGPVYILLRMALPWDHTRLLMFIFGTSILNTAAGAVHAMFIFQAKRTAAAVVAHIQVRRRSADPVRGAGHD